MSRPVPAVDARGVILTGMEPQDPGSDTALAQVPAPRPEPAAQENQPSATESARPEPAPVPDPARPAADAPAVRLGARERAVLDFETRRWKHAGAKEEEIRSTFELSATRYYQILNALLDDPAALAYRPALVTRLRRIRDARRDARD